MQLQSEKMVKNKNVIIALAVAVCLVIALYFYFSSNWNSKDLEKINKFLTNYQFKRDLGSTSLLNYSQNLGSSCIFEFFLKYTVQSPALLGTDELNYSKFNHSLPLLIYVRADLVAKNSLGGYTNEFQQNHYACLPDLPNILSNSQSTSFQYKGIYVFCFSNFTDEGLKSASVFYSGEKPNLYWCFANTMYKNVRISYGEWGFAESENISAFLDAANKTINEFILSYSK
jgi:hypothetical protein